MAQLVNVRRTGLFAHYRLANQSALRLCLSLRDFGEANFLEVDRLVHTFLKGRNRLQAITTSELEKRLKSGGLVVLDVRPEQEYAAGHISSARSIPIEELEFRLKELPKTRMIVAYCRGPYCVFADDAVGSFAPVVIKPCALKMAFPSGS